MFIVCLSLSHVQVGKENRNIGKKTIENSQIYFKAHRVLLVHCAGECELDSIAYLLNRKCDSVVSLPVRTILQSLGCRVGKPYPHLPSPGSVCSAQHQCGYKLMENFIMFDSAFLAEILPQLA